MQMEQVQKIFQSQSIQNENTMQQNQKIGEYKFYSQNNGNSQTLGAGRQFGKEIHQNIQINNFTNDQMGKKDIQFKQQINQNQGQQFNNKMEEEQENTNILNNYGIKNTQIEQYTNLYNSFYNQTQQQILQDQTQEKTFQLKSQLFPTDRNWQNPVQFYAKDIFHYLYQKEQIDLQSDTNYMKLIQQDINEKMRAILIDWLVDVHLKFKLVPETLYMTVNLIDRYLSQNQIQRQKLQLVGVAAMFIACKYEEIYAPEVKDFVYVCDKAYTKEEILIMESNILKCINFNLTQTSSYRFSQRLLMLSQADQKVSILSQYLLELTLIEYKMLKYSASLLGASAVYIAHHIMRKKGWNQIYQEQSNYIEEDLQECGMELFILYQNSQKNNEKSNEKHQLQAVKRKFSSKFLICNKNQIQETQNC